MPKITVATDHVLDRNAVTTQLKLKIAAALQENSGAVKNFSERWPDDHTMEFAFKTMGFAVSGILRSLPNRVLVETTVPFAAMMAKGMIESRLKEEIGKILAEVG
jgi:hypothetical protein